MILPPLWPHQAKELSDNHHNPKLALFWSPRMGKTRAAAEDFKKSGLTRCVVAAPLTVCKDWVDMFTALGYTVIPAYKRTTKTLRDLRPLRAEGAVVVINDDKLANGCEELLRFVQGGMFIGDESHRYKSPSGQRSRAARRLSYTAERVRLLTGTPAPNHYGDLWGQMNGLDREAWEYSFGAYRDKYLIIDPSFPSRVLGHKNLDALQTLVLRFSSIVRREDVFGPDDFKYVTRHVELPKEARKAYDEFAHDWMIAGVISADNTLTHILRLRQIASGFVGDRHVAEVLHSAPIDRLLQDLDEVVLSREKAVVGFNFRWEGAQIANRIRALYPGVPVYEIHGDVPSDERKRAEREFNEGDGSRIIVAQYQTGSLGVSYASAQHLMFISATFSFADMEQMRDRVYAPDPELGKGMRRVIYSYRVEDTIHDFIGEVQDRKGSVHEALRNADREQIAFGRIKKRTA